MAARPSLARRSETLANVTLHNYKASIKYKVTGVEVINREMPHTSPSGVRWPGSPTLQSLYYDWLKLKIVGVSIQIYSG